MWILYDFVYFVHIIISVCVRFIFFFFVLVSVLVLYCTAKTIILCWNRNECDDISCTRCKSVKTKDNCAQKKKKYQLFFYFIVFEHFSALCLCHLRQHFLCTVSFHSMTFPCICFANKTMKISSFTQINAIHCLNYAIFCLRQKKCNRIKWRFFFRMQWNISANEFIWMNFLNPKSCDFFNAKFCDFLVKSKILSHWHSTKIDISNSINALFFLKKMFFSQENSFFNAFFRCSS